MAIRSNLAPPKPQREAWPWHHVKWTPLSASLLGNGDRRMEGENYLAGGYGIRLLIEARRTGRVTLASRAKVWQPSRLKGIQVSRDFGKSFLAATQVFDVRPVPRKWLSLERTEDASERFVSEGTILVTCSGSVGRATLAHLPHKDVLISHDLLRVEPLAPGWKGWLYAYLRSPQGRAMMSAAQYGQIIKHLEVSHLDALPIPTLVEPLRHKFDLDINRIIALRNQAYSLMIDAEQRYADSFPTLTAPRDTLGFTAKASEIFGSRRRLDASRYAPSTKKIIEAFRRDAREVVALSTVTKRVFVPGRFKHIYGDGGTPYLDSADILEINPDITKLVLSLSAEEQEDYRVSPGWLLMPCSGQVYGNIGHVVMATEWHVGKVLSNHIMRVCPSREIRSGYLCCVLGHPAIGRPLSVRFAFGSSVPEIAPDDVATIPVPRLTPAKEGKIADLAEAAAKAQDEADELEERISTDAENLIDAFLAGDTNRFE